MVLNTNLSSSTRVYLSSVSSSVSATSFCKSVRNTFCSLDLILISFRISGMGLRMVYTAVSTKVVQKKRKSVATTPKGSLGNT